MRFILFILLIAFLFPVGFSYADMSNDSQNQEPPVGILSRFWINYAVVDHSLKNDEGLFDTVVKIDDARLDFLSDFWWQKIMRDCDAKGLIHDAFDGSTVEDGKKKANIRVDNCSYWVIYENWDEINKTILNSYKVDRKEKSWFYSLFN